MSKMNRIFCQIALSAIVFVVFSCCPWNPDSWMEASEFPFITFRNNYKDTIVCHLSYAYPDTVLPTFWERPHGGRCPPSQATTIYTDMFRTTLYQKYDVIQLFVYDAKILDAYVDSHPASDSLGEYLKRFELTQKWLEQHDWTVTYP